MDSHGVHGSFTLSVKLPWSGPQGKASSWLPPLPWRPQAPEHRKKALKSSAQQRLNGRISQKTSRVRACDCHSGPNNTDSKGSPPKPQEAARPKPPVHSHPCSYFKEGHKSIARILSHHTVAAAAAMRTTGEGLPKSRNPWVKRRNPTPNSPNPIQIPRIPYVPHTWDVRPHLEQTLKPLNFRRLDMAEPELRPSLVLRIPPGTWAAREAAENDERDHWMDFQSTTQLESM